MRSTERALRQAASRRWEVWRLPRLSSLCPWRILDLGTLPSKRFWANSSTAGPSLAASRWIRSGALVVLAESSRRE